MALRRKLGLLLFGCALLTTVLITFFVNRTIQHQFEQYMNDNQAKRNERLITYFEDYYQSHGTFDERAGAELAHEAYMNDYCLVLMDANSNVIWGMSPDEMKLEAGEIYQAKTYHLMVNDETIGYLEIGQHTPLLLSTEDIYFKQAINQSIVMSAVITIAVVGGISFIFSKPLSKPIKKVSEMALRLAQGDFKEEMIESINIEELDSLQKSMNLLASTLTS
ncbi:MAG: sensor histidine kinase, partial [Turicibacter sp.]|nr:sensor histidine kinase [Turicibacter sp.]